MRPRIGVLLSFTLASAACTSKAPPSAKAGDSASVATTAIVSDSASPASATPAGDSTLASSGSGAVEYYTAADLDRVAQAISHGSSTGRTLRAHPTFSYLQIRRTQNGTPEVHDRWIDVTVVQAGHGTLLSGGRVTGSHAEKDGEHRGGTIQGGTSRPVGAGDLMMIPAGVPHQYLIPAGDSLRYITTKVLNPSR